MKHIHVLFWLAVAGTVPHLAMAADSGRHFAHSDSDKRYVHHIDLYDSDNRKITPESTKPYSPQNTCGRCHDYETISHGWHFNAFRSHILRNPTAKSDETPDQPASANVIDEVIDGRQGEPWIWTDERTGTQLPLSYRDWPDLFNPADAGISEFAMTRQFGGRTPGGSTGAQAERGDNEASSRWELTGDLEVDCMACHAVSGAYDFELRRDTIDDENFAWAPTLALRLGEINGSVARIKEGSDPTDEKVQAKLPVVSYQANRFNPDGTVFIDLVRHVENNACYQCHSQRTVSINDSGAVVGIDERWIHDQDVHLRAGMNCTDCHRNGIDHHITRGFEGEQVASGTSVTTLSCSGCHLGTDFYLGEDEAEASTALREIINRAGRLGSPQPLHEGLPPIHFEKLTCTACHSGPIPDSQAGGLMTSLSHGLGSKAHRTGEEMPSIRGPLFAPIGQEHGQPETTGSPRVTASKAVWPAFWGQMIDGEVQPLSPEDVYAATRRALRVRKDFVDEITKPTLEDEKKSGLFDEKVYAALAAIAKEMEIAEPVYVSTGTVYAQSETEDELKTIQVKNPDKIDMVRWPMAHNVRPAGWALGATGCVECHANDGVIFASTVTPTGPGPVQAEPITMASLQGVEEFDRQLWNQMFVGRSQFKLLTAASLLVLAIMMIAGLATKTYSLLTRSSEAA